MKTPKFWYKDNSILKYILYPLTYFMDYWKLFKKIYLQT